MFKVLCDTGFWKGLLNPNDSYSNSANELYDSFVDIGDPVFLVPYPSLYEFLNTSICGDIRAMERFNLIMGNNCELISDIEYREDALKFVRSKVNYNGRHLSFVDIIIRSILEDHNIKKDFFVTNNKKDFYDAIDYMQVTLEEVLTNEKFANKKK